MGRGISRSRRLTALAPLLIGAGLALGPGYWAWCEYGSGEPGPSFSITERAERWVLEDGSIQRFKGGLGHRPAQLELEPSMNPIRLRLRFQFASDQAVAEAPRSYQATLFEGDQVAMRRAFELGPKGAQTVTLGTVDVYLPGRYLFVLEEAGAPSRAPQSVALETILRVRRPLVPLAGLGVAILLFGLALMVWRFALSRNP